MDAVAQYHFDDFTRENYRRLVSLAASRYPVRTYANLDLQGRFVLWRHDVDMSMHAAEKLAQIEADAGVRATYFLLPHCHYYNLFEPEIRDGIRRIVKLGHEIGLHFDLSFHAIATVTELEARLSMERRWLEELFERPIHAFSFHDAGAFVASCREFRYAGMVNCYATAFQGDIGYGSDSNGYWRHRRLEDVLIAAAEERLQVLTHPEWWQDSPMSPRRRVHRCIDGRAEYLKARYDAGLRAHQRLNITD